MDGNFLLLDLLRIFKYTVEYMLSLIEYAGSNTNALLQSESVNAHILLKYFSREDKR